MCVGGGGVGVGGGVCGSMCEGVYATSWKMLDISRLYSTAI